MTDIYLKISELSSFFRKMCYGLTKDHDDVNDAVQELMIYFLQMNPDSLKAIYDSSGAGKPNCIIKLSCVFGLYIFIYLFFNQSSCFIYCVK